MKEGYRKFLSEDARKHAPRSFDIVGDIAILRIDEEGLCFTEEIAEALLKYHKNIKVVCVDRGVETEYRIRNLKVIAGENRLHTIHKEYGCSFKIDLSKVYFSPRLATERWRVVQSARWGETVIDMFAGVGPFSILLAKHKKCKVVAIDINPHAIELLKENIKINRVEDFVIPILGDAGEVVQNLNFLADRIIMNLPTRAWDYLPIAVEKCRKGGKINYYEIVQRSCEDKKLKEIAEKIRELGYECEIKVRKIREYSPSRIHYGYEITLL